MLGLAGECLFKCTEKNLWMWMQRSSVEMQMHFCDYRYVHISNWFKTDDLFWYKPMLNKLTLSNPKWKSGCHSVSPAFCHLLTCENKNKELMPRHTQQIKMLEHVKFESARTWSREARCLFAPGPSRDENLDHDHVFPAKKQVTMKCHARTQRRER